MIKDLQRYVVDPFMETHSAYKDDFVNVLSHLNDLCDEYGCFTKFDLYAELCTLYDKYAYSMEYEFIKSKTIWSHLCWTSLDGFDIAYRLDKHYVNRGKYFLVIPWDKLEAEEVKSDMPTKSCSITLDDTMSYSFTVDNVVHWEKPEAGKEVKSDMPTKSCSITLDNPIYFQFGSLIYGSKFDIDKIYYNNKTETIVVKWNHGDKTKVQLSKGDCCNLWNGVCAAVMKRKYGSNSAFKTHIEKTMGVYDDRAYMILARAETCDIYHMSYNEFKDMVNEKLIFSVKKK